jgi:large subunit ribosomal protein L15
MLQVHTIKPAKGAKHRFKYIGRGNASGHGTSSTRGGKGQTARSGGSRGLAQKGFRRLMQSAPKLRGFTSLNAKPVEINLTELEKNYSANEVVSVVTLKEKGLLGTNENKAKVILRGELKKKLVVSIPCTKGAAELIKSVGGEVKI